MLILQNQKVRLMWASSWMRPLLSMDWLVEVMADVSVSNLNPSVLGYQVSDTYSWEHVLVVEYFEHFVLEYQLSLVRKVASLARRNELRKILRLSWNRRHLLFHHQVHLLVLHPFL